MFLYIISLVRHVKQDEEFLEKYRLVYNYIDKALYLYNKLKATCKERKRRRKTIMFVTWLFVRQDMSLCMCIRVYIDLL